MLSPYKRVFSEYRILVVKMGLNINTCSIAKDNFNMLVVAGWCGRDLSETLVSSLELVL